MPGDPPWATGPSRLPALGSRPFPSLLSQSPGLHPHDPLELALQKEPSRRTLSLLPACPAPGGRVLSVCPTHFHPSRAGKVGAQGRRRVRFSVWEFQGPGAGDSFPGESPFLWALSSHLATVALLLLFLSLLLLSTPNPLRPASLSATLTAHSLGRTLGSVSPGSHVKGPL